jgi:hypothetical protein
VSGSEWPFTTKKGVAGQEREAKLSPTMDRSIVLLLVGLVFGAAIGFTMAEVNRGATASAPGSKTASGDDPHARHEETLEVAARTEAPELELLVSRDPASGWNVKIDVTRFRFAPEHASLAHQEGEGHAHLYVNGAKVARIYAPWFHLASLPRGKVTVDVALYANDHRGLTVEGEPLMRSVVVDNE